jgi:predicted HicB family RNase H-like nuclease
MNGKKKSDLYSTNLRLPKKLAKRIKDAAENNKRSMNAEIEHALTLYLNPVTNG